MPGFIGMPELLLLALVALILFGPKRLPEMGRGLGRGMREFKDSISGDHHDDNEATPNVRATTPELVPPQQLHDSTLSSEREHVV